jgi:hypothetical protein
LLVFAWWNVSMTRLRQVPHKASVAAEPIIAACDCSGPGDALRYPPGHEQLSGEHVAA